MRPSFRLFATSALVSLVLSSCSPSQMAVQEKTDTSLQEMMENLTRGFHGVAGLYVHNLRTGATAAVHADTLFPTASMIKVPIMCALFDKINSGELKYNQSLLYRDSLKYDDGVTGSFRDSTTTELSEMVMLMITLSDNTASLWCQLLAGTGTAINDWLERNGLHQTRMNSRTPGRRPNWEVYGWGQTTPREMAGLMTMIHQGKAVSPDASEEMFRVLSKPYWDGQAVAQIPPTVHVASKIGAVDASKSEVVLVNAPSGDYVFCVITKNQEDQRWTHENEGTTLIRNVAKTLWHYFEPSSRWDPPPGGERWRK